MANGNGRDPIAYVTDCEQAALSGEGALRVVYCVFAKRFALGLEMRAMAFPPEMQCWVLGPETRAEAVTVGALTPAPHLPPPFNGGFFMACLGCDGLWIGHAGWT